MYVDKQMSDCVFLYLHNVVLEEMCVAASRESAALRQTRVTSKGISFSIELCDRKKKIIFQCKNVRMTCEKLVQYLLWNLCGERV